MKKGLPVRKLKSKFYKKIIEVRVPVRFYWDEDGFDGIEIGPLGENYTPYCHRLISEILSALPEYMHKEIVPKAFEDAFKEEK